MDTPYSFEDPQQPTPPQAPPAEGKTATDLMAKNWRELIRPRTLDIEEKRQTYGKFTCEPLERGFGTTLGNSLRRILRSSLQGAAITQGDVDFQRILDDMIVGQNVTIVGIDDNTRAQTGGLLLALQARQFE